MEGAARARPFASTAKKDPYSNEVFRCGKSYFNYFKKKGRHAKLFVVKSQIS